MGAETDNGRAIPVERWEYRTTRVPTNVDPGVLAELLTRFGDDGWELGSMIPAREAGALAIFKRRLASSNESD
jgi:hypothetical protein